MSVAIPIPLLQHLPDVNVTPAVGVDEYALTYDHDTARFVLRAPSDLSGYALLAGRAGGQTLYGGTAANDDITIHGTSDATRTTSYVLLQPTAGNVGIGTSTPQEKFHVYSNALTYGIFESYADATSTWLGFFASKLYGPALYWRDTQAMRFITTDTILGNVAATERVRISSTGLVGIGTTAPTTLLHVTSTTATTNDLRNILTIGSNVTSTGVGAAGLGAGLLFTMETTTTVDTSAASVQAIIYEATHATRKFDLVLNAYDTAIREGLRIRGDGSGPAIGFYGVAPIARAILATGAGATADNTITALQNLGLVKQS